MKLTGTWKGDLPPIGSFLAAPRGRFAYQIEGVKVVAEGIVDKGEVAWITYRCTFTVNRRLKNEVPAGAIIHDWKWAPREPKRNR